MYRKYYHLLVALIVVILISSANCQRNIWNSVVYYESTINSNDYQKGKQTWGSTDNFSNNLKHGLFSIQIFDNGTFIFSIYEISSNSVLQITGKAVQTLGLSIGSNSFALIANQGQIKFSGLVSNAVGLGMTWKYELSVASLNIQVKRQQVKYEYLSIIILIMFAILGMFLLPLSDQKRNMVLYNIRKRANLFVTMMIEIKLLIVVSCFIIMGFSLIGVVNYWLLLIIYSVYMFCLSPSLIHFLYIISAIQKNINQMQFFNRFDKSVKCFILFMAFALIVTAVGVSCFISKGIFVYYFVSIFNILLYVMAILNKKYVYGHFVIYDLLLTLTISLFSLYLPVMNFSSISYKQILLFWNYYIFLFIFGNISMKKLINIEIVEDVQLQQFSTGATVNPGVTASERRHQIDKPQSQEYIE